MKICKGCDIEKDDSEFYKHTTNIDGLSGKCKPCQKSRAKSYYIENIDKRRKYHRGRADLPHLVEGRAKYRKTKAGLAAAYKAILKYKESNPEKAKAHTIVGNAVRGGRLVREPCEVCGKKDNINAHHDDYSKPLEVRWLCKKHHIKWHKENK